MNIVIIDGQGGGVGRALVEQVKRQLPNQAVQCVGTNAMATGAMLKSGADLGATGENAAIVAARDADVILGPIGIVLADAMLGELTPKMAQAIGSSAALKILIPVGKCQTRVAGVLDLPLAQQIEDAVLKLKQYISNL